MTTQPYIGLRSYQESEYDIFSGRDKHVYELISRLKKNHFLAVVGVSGCGKSSLVKAGLIPKLRSGYLGKDGGTHWLPVHVRPGNRPFHTLAEELFKSIEPFLPSNYNQSVIEEKLRSSPLGLHNVLLECQLPNEENIILVCDQFEEFFRYYDSRQVAEAKNFVSLLISSSKPFPISAEYKSNSIYVVMTMRSDYLENCIQFYGLPELINEGLYVTPKLNDSETRVAIEKPSEICNINIDQSLVAELLEKTEDNPDRLPILQHVLMRLWNIKKSSQPVNILLEDYVALKNIDKSPNNISIAYFEVENIISDHADEIYNKLSPTKKIIAETLFKCLCDVISGKPDARRPARTSEIINILVANGFEKNTIKQNLNDVVDAFHNQECNFLSLSYEDYGFNEGNCSSEIIDITHECLIRQWKTLHNWIKQEKDAAETYLRLVDDAKRYAHTNIYLQGDELRVVYNWWFHDFRPTQAWAMLYGGEYDAAKLFLIKSFQSSFHKIILLYIFIAAFIALGFYELSNNSIALKYIKNIVGEHVAKSEIESAKKKASQETQEKYEKILEQKSEEVQKAVDASFENLSSSINEKQPVGTPGDKDQKNNYLSNGSQNPFLVKIQNTLLIENGKKYLEQAKRNPIFYKDAILSFESVTKNDPDNSFSLYYLGVAHKSINHLNDAKKYFQLYFESTKSGDFDWKYYNIWAHFYLGEIHLSKKEYIMASSQFNKVTALDPSHRYAWYKLGKTAWEQNNINASIDYFNNHIKVNPADEFGYFYLGWAFEKQGNLADAKKCYEQAIHLQKNYVDANARLKHIEKLIKQTAIKTKSRTNRR